MLVKFKVDYLDSWIETQKCDLVFPTKPNYVPPVWITALHVKI